MNQHTPRPWEINKDDTGMNDSGTIEASGIVIVPDVYGRSKGEADANARLIAAAPELLEALEDACLTYAVHGEQPPEKWLAAIAHATGEQVNP